MTSTFFNDELLAEYMPKVRDVTYRTFRPEHLDNFIGLDYYGSKSMSYQDRKQHINFQSRNGPTVTVFHNRTAIAIFGTFIIWDGVGEAWAVFTEECRRYPIAMTKGANAYFDIITILYGLHRLQITVKKKDERAVRWARRLGYIEEGLMIEYSSDKEDTYMMRRSEWVD